MSIVSKHNTKYNDLKRVNINYQPKLLHFEIFIIFNEYNDSDAAFTCFFASPDGPKHTSVY